MGHTIVERTEFQSIEGGISPGRLNLKIQMQIVAVTIAFLLFPDEATASERVSWRCDFSPSFPEPFTFVYDRGNPNGLLVGNNGTAEVWVHSGINATSFVEPLLTGIVQSTTISLIDGKAVHSRHTLFAGEEWKFVNSQVVGVCKPWN